MDLQSQSFFSLATPLPRGIDLLGLALVALFLVLGALRGLWWQVVRLLGLVASVSVARAVAPRMSPGIASLLTGLGPRAANGLAWMLVLVAGLILIGLVGRLGRSTIEAAELGAVDRVGGAIVGATTGILVHIAFLVCLCQLSNRDYSASVVRGTHSQGLLEAVGRGVPMLLDARAAESLAPLRRSASEVH